MCKKVPKPFVGLVILGLFFLLNGCVSNPIKDLQFESVKPIESIHEKEFLAYNLFPPNRMMLKIEISTKSILEIYGAEKSISNEAFFCKDPDLLINLAHDRVFQNGKDISTPLMSDELSALKEEVGDKTKTSERNNYYVYINTIHYGHDFHYYYGKKEYYYEHDLVNNPEDVCIKLIGGYYRKLGYESNTIRIPKQKIADAIKKNKSITYYRKITGEEYWSRIAIFQQDAFEDATEDEEGVITGKMQTQHGLVPIKISEEERSRPGVKTEGYKLAVGYRISSLEGTPLFPNWVPENFQQSLKILKRLTGLQFKTHEEWRKWFLSNRSKLKYSEELGRLVVVESPKESEK